jgi:hypothetical protein
LDKNTEEEMETRVGEGREMDCKRTVEEEEMERDTLS